MKFLNRMEELLKSKLMTVSNLNKYKLNQFEFTRDSRKIGV